MQTIMTLWPYLYIAGYFSLWLLPSEGAWFLLLGAYVLGSLILSICYGNSAKGIRRPDLCRELSDQNRLIKLHQLPCDIVIWGFVIFMCISNAIATANGTMGVGLSNLFLLIAAVPYGLTRLMMLWASAAVCREVLAQPVADRQIPAFTANMHIILHLLPVTDSISAIWVNRKLIDIAWREKKKATAS